MRGLARRFDRVSGFEGGFTPVLRNLNPPYHNEVTHDLPPGELNFAATIENKLYGIMPEALTNAIRHGKAA